jgi:hypothetical protein
VKLEESSELAPILLAKISEMQRQLLLDIKDAQKRQQTSKKAYPWYSMVVSSSTDATMKLSVGRVINY